MRITWRLTSAATVCLAYLLGSAPSSASVPPGTIYSPGGVWYVRGAHNSALDEYFVVWASYGLGGQIQGFRLTSSGERHPTDPGVRLIDAGPSVAPDIAYNPISNTYLVAWSDGQLDNGEIFARFLNGAGQPIGTQFSIFQGAGAQTFPRVAYNPIENLYMVTWSRIGGSGLGGRVAMQMVSGNSVTPTLIGPTVVMETGGSLTPLHPHSPQVAWNAFTDKFLVAWTSIKAGDEDLVKGQVFNGDGSAATGVFTVVDLDGNDKIPSVAANSKNGEFLVTFDQGIGIKLDVWGVMYNSSGTLVKAPFPISTTFNIPDFRNHAAYNADANSYLVTYTKGRGCGGACDDVLGNLIAPDGTVGPVLGIANDDFLQTHGSDDGFGSWGDLVSSKTGPEFLELYQVNNDDINGGIVSLAPATEAIVQVDFPANGAARVVPFLVSGWAIDTAAETGTGVDAVHVWAFPKAGGPATFLGAASLGGLRPDVGATYGSQFTPSL